MNTSPARRTGSDSSIRVFFADLMDWTPFSRENREETLNNSLFTIAASVNEADIIVGRRFGELAKYLDGSRKCVVWTHEPRYSVTSHRLITDIATGSKIVVLNAINGDVYLSPLYYFKLNIKQMEINIRSIRKYTCSYLGTFRKYDDRYCEDVNVDLSEYRQLLSLDMKNIGHCDIYGKGWPKGVDVVEDSRDHSNWKARKRDLLLSYRFNIAIENTVSNNYVTEKIWQAAEAGCVPVYYGKGSGISEVLASSSYLDASKYPKRADLISAILSMSGAEASDMVGSVYADCLRLSTQANKREIVAMMVRRLEERVVDALNTEWQ